MANNIFQERTYKKGAIIWMENSKAMPYFFILKSGLLKQYMMFEQHHEARSLKAGDTFGLTACLTGHGYLNRLIAVEPSTVVMIPKENLISFLSQKQDIFFKIVTDYSQRLRKINAKLFALCSQSVYTENPDYFLETAEFYYKNKQYEQCLYALETFLKYSKDQARIIRITQQIEALKAKFNVSIQEPEKEGHHAVYRAGQIIFLEQEKSDLFYFIDRGKVKISHIDKESEFVVAMLGKGEFFGEMAILNQEERNATAVAFEESSLLVLTKETFMTHLGGKILQNVFTSLAKRIWYSYRRSINLSYENPVTRLYDCLDFIIESNEGRRRDMVCSFDFSLQDLRVMTNTLNVEDAKIKEFINDTNIHVNYGTVSVNNIDKLRDVCKLHVNREHKEA
ncbi:MAG: cyclic nucleotide-binding domain-containing protein [Spirochaetales bacterium]|nr:cyclic nucleotide-binding domain-containing protein [Spirochaetales bacterium]